MKQLNWSRIILGGIAAGLVMNVVDFVTNGVLLADAWKTEGDALNASIMAKSMTSSMVGWITFDLISGILLVWLYAAIRGQFGPGPKTALLAGFMIWLITHIAFASLAFTGLYSWPLVLSSSLGGLVAALAGGYVGGMLYRDPTPGMVTA